MDQNGWLEPFWSPVGVRAKASIASLTSGLVLRAAPKPTLRACWLSSSLLGERAVVPGRNALLQPASVRLQLPTGPAWSQPSAPACHRAWSSAWEVLLAGWSQDEAWMVLFSGILPGSPSASCLGRGSPLWAVVPCLLGIRVLFWAQPACRRLHCRSGLTPVAVHPTGSVCFVSQVG